MADDFAKPQRVRFATGVKVVGTNEGAEVHYPGWHAPIKVPAGQQMSLRIETDVFPCEIEPTDQDPPRRATLGTDLA